MRPALVLGVRLAFGSAAQRGRSLMVAGAAAVSALTLLAVFAIASAQTSSDAFSRQEMGRLMAAMVVAVALPVLALCGTVGRLSAAMRDRRLANLRLLGLSAFRTRVVAATEAGCGAVVGTAVGSAGFVLVRPLIAEIQIGGASWTAAELWPGPSGWIGVLVGLPVVVAAIAVLPRLGATVVLARARRLGGGRSWLLMVPLVAGLVLSWSAWRVNDDRMISQTDVVVLFGSIILIGFGVVVVVPVLVRLLADALLRGGRGPAALIAARRLQAQPAGVNRLVATLLIGLFLVVGARSVVTAFESTPQYQTAHVAITQEQRSTVWAPPGQVDQVSRRINSVDGIRTVNALPILHGKCGRGRFNTCDVVVATCGQLEKVAPQTAGCVDGRIQVLHQTFEPGGTFTVTPLNGSVAGKDRLRFERPTDRLGVALDTGIDASILMPPDTPGIASLVAQSGHQIVVTSDPGRDLAHQLEAANVHARTRPDFGQYDFIVGLRAIVWTLAALILSLGLLAFAITGIDRALSRRRELVGLALVGTSPRVLSRAQWLEAGLPTTVGCLLAIAAGQFAGATFLRLDGDSLAAPWPQAATLAASALAASVVVAGLTVVATSTRISAQQIRAE